MIAKPRDSSQSKGFIEAARTLRCDESEEKFDAALRKVAGHKERPMRVAEVFARYGIPDGEWISSEANMMSDNVWRVAITIKNHSAVNLDIGGAVGLVRDLEAIGETKFAKEVEKALKICRAR